MASFITKDADSYVALQKEESPYNSCQEAVRVNKSPLIPLVIGAGLAALLILAGVSLVIYFGLYHKNTDPELYGITTIETATVKKIKKCELIII